ncbi:MAG: hypothetical protein ACPL7I_04610 [Myxococcota bacterium]
MKISKIYILFYFFTILLSGYILPHWFILKQSAEVRSKFNIGRFTFNSTATLKEGDASIVCNLESTINKKEKDMDIKLTCDDSLSEFRFKDYKLVSQNIKSTGRYFIKPLTLFVENEEFILPLPISSERLRQRVCQIVDECNNVRYKRLGGTINYQFYSNNKENYYMIEKESFLPSALFIKEKNLSIESKKYYSFSPNIKFPSIIEIRNEKQHLIINVEDIDILNN